MRIIALGSLAVLLALSSGCEKKADTSSSASTASSAVKKDDKKEDKKDEKKDEKADKKDDGKGDEKADKKDEKADKKDEKADKKDDDDGVSVEELCSKASQPEFGPEKVQKMTDDEKKKASAEIKEKCLKDMADGPTKVPAEWEACTKCVMVATDKKTMDSCDSLCESMAKKLK